MTNSPLESVLDPHVLLFRVDLSRLFQFVRERELIFCRPPCRRVALIPQPALHHLRPFTQPGACPRRFRLSTPLFPDIHSLVRLKLFNEKNLDPALPVGGQTVTHGVPHPEPHTFTENVWLVLRAVADLLNRIHLLRTLGVFTEFTEELALVLVSPIDGRDVEQDVGILVPVTVQ